MILVCLLLLIDTAFGAQKNVTIGFLTPFSSTVVKGPQFSGAMPVAIEDINNSTSILPNTTLSYIFKDTRCNPTKGLGKTFELINENVDIFIGPACSEACLASGRLSTYMNIPMISYSCSSIHLSDTSTYPYFARLKAFARGSNETTPQIFVKLLQRFRWRQVCTVERKHEIYTPLALAVRDALLAANITLLEREQYYSEDYSFADYGTLLLKMKDKCRVFLLITRSRDVTHLLVHSKRMGLQTKGYVYITVDFLISTNWRDDNLKEWGLSSFTDLRTNILQGLIYVSAVRPKETNQSFIDLAKRALVKVREQPFYDTTMANYTDQSTNLCYLYDAVLLFAKTLHNMLEKYPHSTMKNVSLFSKMILNTTFHGLSGNVKLESRGDRVPDFDIWNYHSGEKVVVGFYGGASDKLELSKDIYFSDGTTNIPPDEPKCGFLDDKCPEEKFDWLPVYVAIPIISFFIIFAAIYLYKKHEYKMSLLCKGLIINLKDLTYGGENCSFKSRMSSMSMRTISRHSSTRLAKQGHKAVIANSTFNSLRNSCLVLYQSNKAYLKIIKNCKIDLTVDNLKLLKKIKDINHTNVNPFIGVSQKSPDLFMLWAYCSKGSLQDVLQNEDIDCDWMFRLSFAHDIAKGLFEIHRSPVGIHGNLKSSNCLIDNRWVCKVSNFGLMKFKPDIKENIESTYEQAKKNFWKAPEILGVKDLKDAAYPTKESDVYSYSIILHEICTREDPYRMEMEDHNLQPNDIIDQVRSRLQPPFRPSLPKDTGASTNFINLMMKCWKDDPMERLTSKEVLREVIKLNKEKKLNGSLVDHMLLMMEKYTNNLEDIVADRTRQLEEEKGKTETLLYKMLPKSVANKLKDGEPVLAEQFTSVTIFFSDIVGFTSLCSESTPLQVVDMLNDLYSCFDNCIENYDVYKVETIGDAYMVVSGLPIRNENRHAGEIATMSLDLLSCVKTFKIKHRPEKQMQLRVGIHTGPCVAGVVGLKMPRYCLFGDTVNYASRMESSGLALRVHVSPECKCILDELVGYHLDERGPVQMKGKGTIITYFLTGKDGFDKPLPDLKNAARLEDHAFK